jgi:hypothetical protein
MLERVMKLGNIIDVSSGARVSNKNGLSAIVYDVEK